MSKKVQPIKITFVCKPLEEMMAKERVDAEVRLQRVYNRIFRIAAENLRNR